MRAIEYTVYSIICIYVNKNCKQPFLTPRSVRRERRRGGSEAKPGQEFPFDLQKEEFTYTPKYSRGMQKYSIPWKEFRNARVPEKSLFPFDTLRLDGVRENGLPITIQSILFADP